MYFLGAMNTEAQEWDHEYRPFVEEGKVWYCHAALPFNTNVHSIDCILTLRGDTLIADQTYKKVLCQYEMYYGDKEQHYFCGVREEAYKVFLMESDTQEEKLLCDFSQPKDTLFFSRPEYEFARLPERHYSRYPDNMFRYDLCSIIDGKANRSYDWGHWVESVGYVYSNPFECKFRREEGRKLQPPVAVLTCMIGDKCLYYHDWDAEPHGIDETTITSTSNETLFDLQGRPLSTPPSRGMYIQNGKKVIK